MNATPLVPLGAPESLESSRHDDEASPGVVAGPSAKAGASPLDPTELPTIPPPPMPRPVPSDARARELDDLARSLAAERARLAEQWATLETTVAQMAATELAVERRRTSRDYEMLARLRMQVEREREAVEATVARQVEAALAGERRKVDGQIEALRADRAGLDEAIERALSVRLADAEKALAVERDALAAGREALARERAALLETRDQLAVQTRAVPTRIAAGVDQALADARSDLDLEKQALAEARNELSLDREALASDRVQLEKDRTAVGTQAIAAFASARDAVEKEKSRVERAGAELEVTVQRAVAAREKELAREKQSLESARAEIPLQVSQAIEAALKNERVELTKKAAELEQARQRDEARLGELAATLERERSELDRLVAAKVQPAIVKERSGLEAERRQIEQIRKQFGHRMVMLQARERNNETRALQLQRATESLNARIRQLNEAEEGAGPEAPAEGDEPKRGRWQFWKE